MVDQRPQTNEWPERIGRWLVSTVAWGPLLLWVLWPWLDGRFVWQPLVGYSAVAALLVNWIYTAQRFPPRSKGPSLVAIGVAFNVSFAVTTQTDDVGTFAAVSLVLGGLASGIVCGLIVVIAVRLARIADYGALEDLLLLSAPLIQGATIAGITAGSIAADRRYLVLGIAAGLMAGLILSVFGLAWVYGIVGLVSSWLARHSDEPQSMWWAGEM